MKTEKRMLEKLDILTDESKDYSERLQAYEYLLEDCEPVVDEMVGVWIPLLVVPDGGWWYVVAAFVLFRFFDILKPLGIRRMEALPGGIGVMMDDILSGIYSLILIIGTQWLIS